MLNDRFVVKLTSGATEYCSMACCELVVNECFVYLFIYLFVHLLLLFFLMYGINTNLCYSIIKCYTVAYSMCTV